jgi:hypothetical protein
MSVSVCGFLLGVGFGFILGGVIVLFYKVVISGREMRR